MFSSFESELERRKIASFRYRRRYGARCEAEQGGTRRLLCLDKGTGKGVTLL